MRPPGIPARRAARAPRPRPAARAEARSRHETCSQPAQAAALPCKPGYERTCSSSPSTAIAAIESAALDALLRARGALRRGERRAHAAAVAPGVGADDARVAAQQLLGGEQEGELVLQRDVERVSARAPLDQWPVRGRDGGQRPGGRRPAGLRRSPAPARAPARPLTRVVLARRRVAPAAAPPAPARRTPSARGAVDVVDAAVAHEQVLLVGTRRGVPPRTCSVTGPRPPPPSAGRASSAVSPICLPGYPRRPDYAPGAVSPPHPRRRPPRRRGRRSRRPEHDRLRSGRRVGAGGAPSSRLVDSTQAPPWVNALDIDPATREFLLTTNRGFYRIGRESGRVQRCAARSARRQSRPPSARSSSSPRRGRAGSSAPAIPIATDRCRRFSASSARRRRPHVAGDLAPRQGRPAQDRAQARPHVRLRRGHRRAARLARRRHGFSEQFTPSGAPINDFEVDPADPQRIVAASDGELFRSANAGASWERIDRNAGIRLAWPAPDALYRALKDGSVQRSADGGTSWRSAGRVGGEPYRFKAISRDELYLALSDATILHTRDAARTWEEAFRP